MERQNYRDTLIELEQKSQAEYDRLIVTLSGGALGISFAFVDRFVGDETPRAVCALGIAWFVWVGSLACVLWSHYASVKSMRKAVMQVDNGEFDKGPVGGNYDSLLKLRNPLGGVLFVIGAISAGVFVSFNVR